MSVKAEYTDINITTETLTAYELITTLNKWFTENGIEKTLPPQMGYTYVKKGMVDGIKGAHKVTREAAYTWYGKYLVKNAYISE
jgi:hypothetical protein